MRYLVAITGALLSLSCATDRGIGGAMSPVITVFNGITTVTNPALVMADSMAWSIDSVAAVRIGVENGPQEYMIGRLAGMLRRSDGTILIADAASHEVKVFDDSGKFLRRAGAAGTGPGEYNWLTHILPHSADSIAVMDHEGSRANIVDPNLGFVRQYRTRLQETRAPTGMTSHQLVGFFDDGTLLMSDYLNVCGPRRRQGYCEDSVAFFRVGEDGAVLSRFGQFVYSRSVARSGEVNTSYSEPHPQAFWGVQGSRFYYADAKRFEVRVFSRDGTPERLMNVSAAIPRFERSQVFPAARQLAPQADAKMAAAMRSMQAMFAEAELPDSFPAFSDMLIDDAGYVWVREYLPQVVMAARLPRWFIFDPEGRLSFAVRSLPALQRIRRTSTGLHPQIGRDFVLASARDENGVESVVMHRLIKR